MRPSTKPPDLTKPVTSANRDWLFLHGKSLREIEAGAIRALKRLGLGTRSKLIHLTDGELARTFERHRRKMAAELGISDSTLMRWLNKTAPFATREETP